MDKKDFTADIRGQIFSLDVLLALVLITIILGISADAIDMASYKSTEYSARFSLERVTTDAADMLIKTPGSPDDWEKSGISNSTTPGLAEIDSETNRVSSNVLSLKKIDKLKDCYNTTIYGKVLPYGVNSSMMIYPSNSSLIPISILNNSPSGASEVAVVNRTVLIKTVYIETVIYKILYKNPMICPHPSHQISNSSSQSNWGCNYFNISKNDLNTSDFYLVTVPPDIKDSSSSWIMDRPENTFNGTEEYFSPDPININQKILNLLENDDKGVMWLHIKTPAHRTFDAYILNVPKGTPPNQVNLNDLNPEPWFFVLKVWY